MGGGAGGATENTWLQALVLPMAPLELVPPQVVDSLWPDRVTQQWGLLAAVAPGVQGMLVGQTFVLRHSL